MFLSVESNCFDERNVSQQFSESLEDFGGLFSIFGKFPVVPPVLSLQSSTKYIETF
jgi:hypothetical protein